MKTSPITSALSAGNARIYHFRGIIHAYNRNEKIDLYFDGSNNSQRQFSNPTERFTNEYFLNKQYLFTYYSFECKRAGITTPVFLKKDC